MKRLYVGGLSHTVTDKDLKDRFGKFGKVEDVELKTRTDEQGVPLKTFGYINITISDSDLKKCQSVLNKSQWKGGTLQIETAKQSFLQRLSQEREEAVQRSLKPPEASAQQQHLDSLRQAGVSNFTMKSAVPGTEIPGHKDWVVGKFGRVLPILQLNCRRGSKVRTMKYDPSKYGHNLRVLAPPPGSEATPTPVSELTWQVAGGDDDISRKRRGEFPPFTPQKKKPRERPPSDLIGSCNGSSRPVRLLRPPLDSESDEELQRIVQSSHNALGPEDDTLEVVSTNYTHSKRNGDDDRDSADTDELFASRKPQTNQNQTSLNDKVPKKKLKKHSTQRSKYDSTDDEEEEDSGKMKPRKVKKSAAMAATKGNLSKETKRGGKERTEGMKRGDEERTEETSEGGTDMESDNDTDFEYDTLFSNVTRLELSLSDLQTLAQKFAPEETQTHEIISTDEVGGASRTPKKGTTPEEILASILESGSSDEEEERGKKRKQKKKKKCLGAVSLPAFTGTKGLEEEAEPEKTARGKMEETLNPSSVRSQEDEASSSEYDSSISEEKEELEAVDSSSNDEEFTGDEDEEAGPKTIRVTAEQEEAGHLQAAHQRRPTAEEEAELQRRANERRLAAVQQRQKETEQNRKLIQGALSKLDGASGGCGGKHIVFGSDDEEDDEAKDEDKPKQSEPQQDQSSVRQNQPSAPRLFDSDDDGDNDDGNKEEDMDRFEIRPEFEGEAGLKLMELQSRFGTDQRFKMDARFLDDGEDDEDREKLSKPDEEALETEKQKNLHILQNLLGTSAAPSDRAKAKTFRDVSALHYDPSKEEHAAYERKTEEQKESKASRRKKREEAQKLPDVSKEIFFEVHADLKAVFGKEQDQEEQQLNPQTGGTNWDQEEEPAEEGGDKEGGDEEGGDEEKEETGGFKFSFFGDDPEPQQTEYTVESISAPKLSWQQDPNLNDSSDEEEEDGEEEEQAEEGTADAAVACAEDMSLTSDLFFFFSTNDRRLTDGPRWFCRTSLEEQREVWEETRTHLRQDCKKKHKDARRKLQGSVRR